MQLLLVSWAGAGGWCPAICGDAADIEAFEAWLDTLPVLGLEEEVAELGH